MKYNGEETRVVQGMTSFDSTDERFSELELDSFDLIETIVPTPRQKFSTEIEAELDQAQVAQCRTKEVTAEKALTCSEKLQQCFRGRDQVGPAMKR